MRVKSSVRKRVLRKPAASLACTRKDSNIMPNSLPVGRQALFFGCRRRPAKLIVLLHGLNDSAKCCAKGVVTRWAAQLPKALIAVPQSSFRTEYSSDGDPGYTWINMKGIFPFDAQAMFGIDSDEFKASIEDFHSAVRRSCKEVNKWLDAMLEKYDLTNKDLVISGFSQGSIIAAILGAKRNIRGTIVCGGVPYVGFLELEKLMPERSRTQFLAVNGTRDSVVERKPLEAMLSPYDCEWHWSKGVGHDFPSAWYTIERKWMKRLFDT